MIYYQAERFWGEMSVNTGHLPGTPGVAAFRRPYQTTIGNRNAIIEERGVGLAVGDLVVLQNNVYTSAVGASVRGQFRQTRPIDASGTPRRDAFVDRATVGGTLVASIRTQRNIRDLVPRTGAVATTTAETDLYTSGGSGASRALQQQLDLYWPLLSSVNGGLRTGAAILTQSESSIFDTESFLPRGYHATDLAGPGSGTHVRLDAAYTQPLWYIDAGSALVPVHLDALYGFGLAQAQYRLDTDVGGLRNGLTDRRASITSGLGIEISSVRVELGLAYRFDLANIGSPEAPSDPGAWGVVLSIR